MFFDCLLHWNWFSGRVRKIQTFISERFFSQKKTKNGQSQSNISLIVLILLDWVVILIVYDLTSCQIKEKHFLPLLCVLCMLLLGPEIFKDIDWIHQLNFFPMSSLCCMQFWFELNNQYLTSDEHQLTFFLQY